jgi:hypothetical protein
MSPQVTQRVRRFLPLLDIASGDALSMRLGRAVGLLQSRYWLIFQMEIRRYVYHSIGSFLSRFQRHWLRLYAISSIDVACM